jgi:hypothetical protein
MTAYIQKILDRNEDILIFKNDAARERWAATVEEYYQGLDERNIIHRKNRTEVNFDAVETHAIQLARPHLLIKSTNRYFPKFVDRRNTETRAKAMTEVEKVVDFFLDKMGIAFKLEHLGDTTARAELKAFIARNFLFEGDSEGSIFFRRHYQGMFGDPIDPEVLIKQYAGKYEDGRRTADKQAQQKKEIEDSIINNLGLQRGKLTLEERQKVDALTKDAITESKKAYTTKRLPVRPPNEYKEEFHLRNLHRFGIINERLATPEERMKIDALTTQAMEDLNKPPKFEIPGFTGKIKPTSWEGLDSVENPGGIFLTSDQL